VRAFLPICCLVLVACEGPGWRRVASSATVEVGTSDGDYGRGGRTAYMDSSWVALSVRPGTYWWADQVEVAGLDRFEERLLAFTRERALYGPRIEPAPTPAPDPPPDRPAQPEPVQAAKEAPKPKPGWMGLVGNVAMAAVGVALGGGGVVAGGRALVSRLRSG